MAKQEKSVKAKIIEASNELKKLSTDAEATAKVLRRLRGLQKQEFSEDVELFIPLEDVTERYNFGATELCKTKTGYLFIAKGGLYTFVSFRMVRVCDLLEQIIGYKQNPSASDEERRLEESFTDCVLYNLQAIIFASMSAEVTVGNAAAIVGNFNAAAKELLEKELKEVDEETEKDNIAFQQATSVLQNIQ